MGRELPPPLFDEAALFLDVDGTLIEITSTPTQTRVDPSVRSLLEALVERLSGAVALVSGRSLAQLDALFAPLQLPSAGLHGLERRSTATGEQRRVRHSDLSLEPARTALGRWVAAHPQTLLEDKGASLALHFRLAPQFAAPARAAALAELARLGTGYQLLEGKCVVELKPAGFTKASAIEEFLREPPFAGRVPVFAGDDLSDQDALQAVDDAGGVAVAVGERVDGAYFLPHPEALREWLRSFITAVAPVQSRV